MNGGASADWTRLMRPCELKDNGTPGLPVSLHSIRLLVQVHYSCNAIPSACTEKKGDCTVTYIQIEAGNCSLFRLQVCF